jgi:hypothetical protein
MKRRSKGEGSIYFSESKNCWVGQVNVGKNNTGTPIRKTVYGKLRKDVSRKITEIQS